MSIVFKPRPCAAASISTASSRLKSSSGRPRALVAPGSSMKCPTSTATVAECADAAAYSSSGNNARTGRLYTIERNPIRKQTHAIQRLRSLRFHRGPHPRGQRSDHAAAPAAGEGRAGDGQDHARRGGCKGARAAAARMAHQVHHQGAAGPVRIRRGEPPARFAARRSARARDRQLHRQGHVVAGVHFRDAGRAPHRRNRQGRHRVSQRPLARARPHGVFRLRDQGARPRGAAPHRLHHLEQRKGAARRLFTALLLSLHPLPRQGNDGENRRGALSRAEEVAPARSARGVLRGARGARAEEKALDLGAARLAEAAARRGHSARRPESQGPQDDHPAAARRAVEKRAGCAPVRASYLHVAAKVLTARPRAMLSGFFVKLKDHKIPVSIKEWLTLLEAMQKDVISPSIDEFYYLSRTTLVKDEQNFDKFDRAFGEYFKGIESVAGAELDVPLEWLLKQAELNLSPEENAMIEAMGGWEKLMGALKKRLEEQKGRHQGGNKWIGTAGTSPFGAYGYNPEGVRIGQDKSRNRSAVKVWDAREYRNLDDSVELGTRNIKVALRRLRKFAREGAPEELDLDTTIDKTARNAGYLDLSMRPERHNAARVLMFLDIGGTMDDHIKLCEELFSAAKTEFKHLEYFYFHNCLYDYVWKDNLRRHSERTRTFDIMHKYGHDYKLVFVGDATMSPYEVLQPGGSIEYSNDEAGAVWLRRVLEVYPRAVWLNPEPEEIWPYRQSIGILKEIMGGRMYPTTILGLERAMRALVK